MDDKRLYIEYLNKILTLFNRIDFERYEEILQDDESPGVVSGTLKRMLKDVSESDDEAWENTAGSGLAERHRLEGFGI